MLISAILIVSAFSMASKGERLIFFSFKVRFEIHRRSRARWEINI